MFEKEIHTEKLVLKDSLGNSRAVLECDSSGVSLTFASHLDRRAIMMCVDGVGNPVIMLLDRMGKTRLSLSLTDTDDHPDIMLNDAHTQSTAFITINSESGPSVNLRHRNGQHIFLANPEDGPLICVNDSRGLARVQLTVENHRASVQVFDAAGRLAHCVQ